MEMIKALFAKADGVPLPHEPVYWGGNLGVATNLNVVDAWVRDYSRWLPDGVAIDEAAIMVPSATHVSKLAMKLADAGWEMFNWATDLVYTNPFATRYVVGYTFFRHPDYAYRLEVMHATTGTVDGASGFSPLHQALWYPNGDPARGKYPEAYPMPHLSYKPDTKHLKPTKDYAVEVGRLQDLGFIHAQTCRSTYGQFGYYLPGDAFRQLYLKPRVNLRDAA